MPLSKSVRSFECQILHVLGVLFQLAYFIQVYVNIKGIMVIYIATIALATIAFISEIFGPELFV